MKRSIRNILCILPLLLAGCASFQGQKHLDSGEFAQGLTLSRQALAEDPADPQANYYAARFLLAQDRPEDALPLMRRAVQLDPDNADHHFWLGVNHWALFNFEAERTEYKRAIALEPEHMSAHLYLGHSYLDAGEWQPALREYDKVLEIFKLEPGAMFNRALALDKLDRTAQAHAALLEYMTAYPDGDTAMRATEILQSYGDFTYRNFIIGKRTVPLRFLMFERGTTTLAYDVSASLDVLGAMLENNRELRVHIVAYVNGDSPLAKRRAERLQQYIVLHFPGVSKERLLLSWFGTGERISTPSGDFRLPESVNLITETGQRSQ